MTAGGAGAIEIRGARLEYALSGKKRGTFLALSDVNLSIAPGEFVSIIGPSGCGKTTLLMAVAGLASLTAGTVSVDGVPIRGPGMDRAVVFQEPGLLPWRTVQANIELGLEAKGVAPAERREISRHYLRMVSLSRFGEAYPHQLSGGMRQRVGIARALAVNPQVLLMDEPMAALDAQTREQLGTELLQIWAREKKTVLFVTHSLDEAIYLSDRIVLMTHRPGRIRTEMSVSLPRPRDEAVRNSAEFAAMRAVIWKELSAEVKQAETAALDSEEATA